MIQRRQTIYLLLASIIAALLLVLNLTFFESKGLLDTSEIVNAKVGYFTSQFDEKESINNTYLIGAMAAYAGLTFITIFLYKNRRRQILACTLGYAFLILSVVLMYKYSYGMGYYTEVKSQDLTWTAIIPLSLFILHFLALQGIKNDEALVKSLDRIR